jgi:DNA mismatch repair protein MutL
MRQQLVDWAKGKMSAWGTGGTAGGLGSAGAGDAAFPPSDRPPLDLQRLDRPWGRLQNADETQRAGLPPGATPSSEFPSGEIPPAHFRNPPALQVHNRYLVAETDEGVMVVDQHALHERILYEDLRRRMAAGAIETQSLLVPEPVDLSAPEAAAALEHRDLLAELGMKVEPFGGTTVLIAGFPAMLANMNPVEVLRDLLERLVAGGKQPDRRDLLDELLHTIACKAAIKAGDRLAPEEVAALLEQRHLVDDPHHCPHGRPTALIFTREELDRQFKRV